MNPYHLEKSFYGPRVNLGRTRAKVTFFERFFIHWLCSPSAGRVKYFREMDAVMLPQVAEFHFQNHVP